MTENRFYKILSRVVHIKPGEELIAFSLFLYFFLITAPYYIIKPLRDADYLNKQGYEKLPIAYLLTAVLIGFIVAFHTKLQTKIPRHHLFILTLLFFFFSSLIFWSILPQKWSWQPLVFWVWANTLIVVLVTQFWLLVSDIFNPREAKRLIGFFGSGGILGGIFGGILAVFFAKSQAFNFLLLFAAGMLLACVFVVHFIFLLQKKRGDHPNNQVSSASKGPQKAEKMGFKDLAGSVLRNPYLRLLAAVVTLTWIVSTLIDFQFKGVINLKISAKDDLTAFFAIFNTILLIFSFVLQLLLTSRIIKKFGIRLTLLIYPVLLLLFSLGIAAAPAFMAIYFGILIKGSDKSLSYSLNQSVRELLYIPISPELKSRSKIFIDMFLNRFAKGIGALLLMAVVSFSKEIRYVSLLTGTILFAWIILNLKISREYTKTVKQKLKIKWERAEKIVDKKMDVHFTKLVLDTLDAKERSSTLYAMDLFDLIKQDKLTPEVKELISSKSDEMKIASLATLFEAEEESLSAGIEDYLNEDILEKDVEEITSLEVYQKVMGDYVRTVMNSHEKHADIHKMEVAKALGLMSPLSPLADTIDELIEDESIEVSRYAVESAGKLQRRQSVPAIIRKLYHPAVREDARTALEKYGQKITGTLSDYLEDSEEDLIVRKELASILAGIGSQEAADFLVWALEKGEDAIITEIIDALDRIRSENSSIYFSSKIIGSMTIQEIKKYYKLLVQLGELTSAGKDFPGSDISKNLSVSFMNIFKLLGLLYPHKDIMTSYQNMLVGTPEAVAYAVELMENTLQKEMKELIFPIIEDLPLEEKIKKARTLLKNSQSFKKAR